MAPETEVEERAWEATMTARARLAGVIENELPESWRPKVADVVTAKGPPALPEVDALSIPECDVRDPAQLAAYYGPFGWADHLRKIVLANCRESIRAQHVQAEVKITESRLDDLAHRHGSYVAWITRNLNNRALYYQEALKHGIGG